MTRRPQPVGPIRRDLAAWISALGGATATPAGGALSLATLAGVAALAAKVARLSDVPAESFDRDAEVFLQAADHDAELYGPAARAGGRKTLGFLREGVAVAGRAVALIEDLDELQGRAIPAAKADVTGARHLTWAAALMLLENLQTNAALWRCRTPGMDEIDRATAALAQRLSRN